MKPEDWKTFRQFRRHFVHRTLVLRLGQNTDQGSEKLAGIVRIRPVRKPEFYHLQHLESKKKNLFNQFEINSSQTWF